MIQKWFIKFWNKHGTRLCFMTITLMISWVMHKFLGMTGEAKMLVAAVGTLAINKTRSPDKDEIVQPEPPKE